MPAKVMWYDPDKIILYVVSAPVTVDDLEEASEEIWALAGGIPDLIDIIFDYSQTTGELPRGGMRIVKEGSFKLPNLERVALVGDDSMIEMMFATIAQETYRPDPTIHPTIDDAAAHLRRLAEQDRA
ncbi:MAG TPA: STAS/SEC14 domain-containing protein [Aggregatilineales bacterium]|nr:STAS/SEC14 domain-containing protein [Anaerolineales bacterium]HRE46438.1 STAS/SEC14 domain-containing protein [Aggregatilineales bacterium]